MTKFWRLEKMKSQAHKQVSILEYPEDNSRQDRSTAWKGKKMVSSLIDKP